MGCKGVFTIRTCLHDAQTAKFVFSKLTSAKFKHTVFGVHLDKSMIYMRVSYTFLDKKWKINKTDNHNAHLNFWSDVTLSNVGPKVTEFLCLRGTWGNTNEPCHEKTNILVFDLVRLKPGCTATEDG